MKMVINKCFGGFDLSNKAIERFKELGGLTIDRYGLDIVRNDSILIQVVEELGDLANNKYCELKIVEIPDDVEWQIEEYDGREWIAEKHRTWS